MPWTRHAMCVLAVLAYALAGFGSAGAPRTLRADVFVAGAGPVGWEHFEQMTAGFGAGEAELDVPMRVDAAACRYVRFLSLADGWSDSVYIPGLKVEKGMMIVIRKETRVAAGAPLAMGKGTW